MTREEQELRLRVHTLTVALELERHRNRELRALLRWVLEEVRQVERWLRASM